MSRTPVLLLVLAASMLPACARRPAAREYDLRGQVLAVHPERNEIVIRHEDIKGLMPAMTMPFTVKDPQVLTGRVPGDLVKAKLVVTDDNAFLSVIQKLGSAPVPEWPAATAGAVDLLEPGDAVPDVSLTDEQGRAVRFSSLHDTTVVVTFIYTRCPFPNFCPLMDRNFGAIQQAIQKDSRLRSRVRLFSISFDPAFDTPAVLKKHAAEAGADPAIWSFLTGDQAGIDAFAGRFGLSVQRDPKDASNVIHNLRTAIVDGRGRLVKYFGGNDWTPDQVVSALGFVAAS